MELCKLFICMRLKQKSLNKELSSLAILRSSQHLEQFCVILLTHCESETITLCELYGCVRSFCFIYSESGALIKTMPMLCFVVKVPDECESHACFLLCSEGENEKENSNTKLRSVMIIFNYNSPGEKRFARRKIKNLS